MATGDAIRNVMDYDKARFNMVESQVRTWEVLDAGVLALLFKVKREDFVPPAYRSLAFVDMEIPLGQGEVMLAPKLEARMLQELAVQPGDTVLEVGTGTGYTAALLGMLAGTVHTVEIHQALHESATRNLRRSGFSNVTTHLGNAAAGWKAQAPYDAIVLTGSVPLVADTLKQQLKVGGRLVVVEGKAPIMTAKRFVRTAEDGYTVTGLFETCIPSLRNAPQPDRFEF